MAKRWILAFAISPAVVPLCVAARALATNVPFRESVVLGSVYAAFTYGAAVAFGIPTFYAFARRGWTKWSQHAVAGAAIALALLAIASTAAREWFFRTPIVLLFIAIGVLSTTAFWFIAAAPWGQRVRRSG